MCAMYVFIRRCVNKAWHGQEIQREDGRGSYGNILDGVAVCEMGEMRVGKTKRGRVRREKLQAR